MQSLCMHGPLALPRHQPLLPTAPWITWDSGTPVSNILVLPTPATLQDCPRMDPLHMHPFTRSNLQVLRESAFSSSGISGNVQPVRIGSHHIILIWVGAYSTYLSIHLVYNA